MVLLAAAPRARVGDGDDFALPIIPRLTDGIVWSSHRDPIQEVSQARGK
jgi:hypothetical protein